MPELISDGDGTDSDDGSPTNLHTFDSKQFFYEAVSAELDRYLDGPQSTIVYSTHIPGSRAPRWSDTRVAQDSDMLQQFIISSRQGRIHHFFSEHIIIDPELTQDQDEERWWTHHWGLVRQNMRASYPGVSDQVIDGPMHDLYRAHYHYSQKRRGSYVFEDMYPEFDIAYGEDVAPFYYQERDEFQRIIFGGPVRTHGP